MGLLSGGHCIAMCGSLSMALGFSIPNTKPYLIYASIIGVCRILGYAFIGLIMSLLAQSIVSLTNGGVFFLSILSSILMIGIGFHIAGINSMILVTEKMGAIVQPFLSPLKKRLLPIDSLFKCALYGFFWGFLPCGLVYTALSLAITSENPVSAAVTMFAFGLGTLPLVTGMTSINSKLNSILKKSYVRLSLGLIIILMASYQLLKTIEKFQSF